MTVVNETIVNATFVIETLDNATLINETIVNAILANQSLINATVNTTIFNATHITKAEEVPKVSA